MTETRHARNLLVVSEPSPWIPDSGSTIAGGPLAVERAGSLKEAGRLGAGRGWDVVAFHVEGLRPLGPERALAALREIAPDATFLPVTFAANAQEAVFYLKHGAFEYLEEPLGAEDFLRALGEAIENRETFQEILDLNQTLESQKEQLLKEKSELERKNRELEAVSRLARALASTLDLGEILAQLAREVKQTFLYRRVIVGLVDRTGAWEDTREDLADEGATPAPPYPRWSMREARRQPWIRQVFREGRILRVDAPTEDELVRGTPLDGLHENPFVKVPLAAGNRVVGTITAETRTPGETVSAEDLATLAILADTAAVAVENARLYETMVDLSVRDELTGLFNRRHFLQQLAAECTQADRHGSPLSLLMLDIDHFKQLNDGNDHLTGDEALRRLAGALLKNTRGIDTVARYGGEEFVVLLPRTPRPSALIVAEKLRRVIEKTLFEGEEVLPGGTLTVSIGLASCPEDSTEPQDLLERADWALYQAKDGGRNQVCCWEAEARAESS